MFVVLSSFKLGGKFQQLKLWSTNAPFGKQASLKDYGFNAAQAVVCVAVEARAALECLRAASNP